MPGAAKLTDRDVGTTPASTYDQDFYAWTVEQASFLRVGAVGTLDLEHLAEEIEDLGREQLAKIRGSFRIILLHMLKWDQQPERRSRSWASSIRTHRFDIDDVLDDSPSLRRRRQEALGKAYRWSRIQAAEETGLPQSQFPVECPYSLDDVLNRPFESPED